MDALVCAAITGKRLRGGAGGGEAAPPQLLLHRLPERRELLGGLASLCSLQLPQDVPARPPAAVDVRASGRPRRALGLEGVLKQPLHRGLGRKAPPS